MRKIVGATLSLWIAFALFVTFSSDAQAVTGYDSGYAGESDFIELLPGATGTFTVFFMNRGSTSWVRGGASQVNLVACRDDKVTCNVVPEESAFNDGTWYSATSYATHTQLIVAPNTVGTFFFKVKAPTSITTRTTFRFNGDLALGVSSAMIHPQGYYQDATVTGSNAGGGGTTAAQSCAGADCDIVAGLATQIVDGARSFLRTVSGFLGMRA